MQLANTLQAVSLHTVYTIYTVHVYLEAAGPHRQGIELASYIHVATCCSQCASDCPRYGAFDRIVAGFAA